MKLLFFGNERLATGVTTTAPVLTALIEAGYEIPAVIVTKTARRESRKERPLEILEVAKKHNIPVLDPVNPIDIKDKIKELKADAGVLVAYGRLVHSDVLDMFPKGIINIHPSLLPKHRGATPIEQVILLDERETGVSLMKLVPRMDAGPVYAQKKLKVRGDETKQELADKLLDTGKQLLIKHLPAILDGSLDAQEQEELEVVYDKRVEKDDALIEPAKETANEISRKIRAYAGWPRTRAMIGTTQVIIARAHVEDITGVPGTLWINGKNLGIHCSEGTIAIDELIPAGKKQMSAAAFLAGYSPF